MVGWRLVDAVQQRWCPELFIDDDDDDDDELMINHVNDGEWWIADGGEQRHIMLTHDECLRMDATRMIEECWNVS